MLTIKLWEVRINVYTGGAEQHTRVHTNTLSIESEAGTVPKQHFISISNPRPDFDLSAQN